MREISWVESFTDWTRGVISPFLDPPASTFFVLAVTLSLAVFGVGMNLLLTDVKRLKALDNEVKVYDASVRRAKRINDKVLLRKLKRDEARIKTLRSRYFRQRLKAYAVTFAPTTLVYIFLYVAYSTGTVARAPYDFPIIGREISFVWWYLLCYFSTYTPLSRLFSISYETTDVESEARKLAQARTADKKPKKA